MDGMIAARGRGRGVAQRMRACNPSAHTCSCTHTQKERERDTHSHILFSLFLSFTSALYTVRGEMSWPTESGQKWHSIYTPARTASQLKEPSYTAK